MQLASFYSSGISRPRYHDISDTVKPVSVLNEHALPHRPAPDNILRELGQEELQILHCVFLAMLLVLRAMPP